MSRLCSQKEPVLLGESADSRSRLRHRQKEPMTSYHLRKDSLSKGHQSQFEGAPWPKMDNLGPHRCQPLALPTPVRTTSAPSLRIHTRPVVSRWAAQGLLPQTVMPVCGLSFHGTPGGWGKELVLICHDSSVPRRACCLCSLLGEYLSISLLFELASSWPRCRTFRTPSVHETGTLSPLLWRTIFHAFADYISLPGSHQRQTRC